jgi:hypothetical protein
VRDTAGEARYDSPEAVSCGVPPKERAARALLLITATVEPTLELSSEIYETLIGMPTDVYPRDNCIAPAIVLIVWTTDTKNGRGLAPDCVPIVAIRPQKREASHTGGTQERWVWVGTRSRVIDLRLPTGREGVGGGVEGGEGSRFVAVT